MSERFRHEDIASVPAGWKVRTVTTSGGHRVRVAFPPGRRKTGAGRLVSILHPLTGANPCGNPCSVRSSNPQELIVMGANPPRRRNNPPELAADEQHQLRELWHTARIAGYNKFGERIVWAAKQWERAHPGQRMRAYKWLSSEMRGYGEGGSGRGMNNPMPANPYYSEKIDQGNDRVVIWANTEAGPFHVQPYVNMPDGTAIRERGRGYSTLQRARKVAQKWLDEQRAYKRNPHELLIMGANPRVEVVHGENPPVEDIHEEFTGQEVKWIDVYNEPHMPAGRYAELGPLIALYVKPVKGGQVLRIGAPENHEDFADWWDKKPPIIVTDSSARQIYFVNGCQDLSNLLEQFGAVPEDTNWTSGIAQQLYRLGQVRRIDYECRKEHVADPDEDRWKHDHGDEDGELPTLLFDAHHKRMLYQGGNYRIEGPWIKN